MNMEGFFLNDEPPNPGETLGKLHEKIDPFFETLAENVKGSHIGGRALVLDVLLKPKPALIKDGFADIVVGVTFRDPLYGAGAARDLPRKGKELIDYAHTRFGQYGALPLLLVYPGFFSHMRNEQKQRLGEATGFFERLMAQFNVGELKPEAKNLVLTFGGTRYWDSVFGVNSERSYHFTPLIF
ncbi:MAG: hypothetical protein HXX08_05895 [Chloroflexi bacterium]|uniref:Uncharacterized protein n=1 Tax=Candidatus Chlorohelix allophototropha TaxID=3003348 RepID=A0A8T7LTP1_9CHLR|nr:hypothetical protein [Chloroflexota bacterium]WJW67266.1 hypothetical protein OZ401_000526 [Chloroflexota bacterium L227-S17]